jgi:putative FmdB family regulatory protein
MPTYEFRCPEGHEFEKFYRKISDAVAELPCPECGKIATRLVSGGAGLLFKGSGFYLTDYGKNAHRRGGPTSGGDSSKGGSDGKTTEGSGTSGGESKASESKASESKSSDAKPSEAKSAGETKPAKKPSSGTSNSDS